MASFLTCHAHKASPSKDPCVYLYFLPEGSTEVPVHAKLVRFSMENVKETLDVNSDLVRWLLKQLNTYDCQTQRIVGLVFGFPKEKGVVLTEVLRVSN